MINELSEDLKKELGIKEEDEYNNNNTNVEDLIIDPYKMKNKDKRKKKNEPVLSKTKLKEQRRRAEYFANKKIQSQNKAGIMAKLEEFNSSSIVSYLTNLSSIKDLGIKEKEKKDRKIDDEDNTLLGKKRRNSNKNNSTNNDLLDNISEYSNDDKSVISHFSDSEDEDNDNKRSNINNYLFENINIMAITKENIFNRLKSDLQKDIETDLIDLLDIERPPIQSRKMVNRKDEIQEGRIKLPVINVEQDIIELINTSYISILTGETGSGKSTQIPQFLYEYGYTDFGMIGITQPRKVAAMTLSKRVSDELNIGNGDTSKNLVAYQVRNNNTTDSNTRIKFMTDGILLRELESDPLLLKYSVLIIDEAHERTLNTDILIGFLIKIIRLRQILNNKRVEYKRCNSNNTINNEKNENEKDNNNIIKPLRLIIMSATISVNDFVENKIFRVVQIPRVFQIEARQYEVKVFQTKKTNFDYTEEAYNSICKIHRNLPSGGVLVFLTGKKEINDLCRKLQQTFERDVIIKSASSSNKEGKQSNLKDINKEGIKEDAKNISTSNASDTLNTIDAPNDLSDSNNKMLVEEEDRKEAEQSNEKSKDIEIECPETHYSNNNQEININKIEEPNLDDEIFDILKDEDNSNKDEEIESQDNIKKDKFIKESNTPVKSKLKALILPLYSSLPIEEQNKIFDFHKNYNPEETRLIVISTNVAETSVTIPNIKYVIDAGREKSRVFNLSYSSYETNFISQASANQRKGRAGRTGPGFCYRLYSNGLLAKMKEQNDPQILISPLDQVLLYLKSLRIQNIFEFPFLNFPSKRKINYTLNHLNLIGALESVDNNYKEEQLLELIKVNNENEKEDKKKDKKDNIDDEDIDVNTTDNYLLTPLGALIVKFPLKPRNSKVLIVCNKLGLLNYGIIIASVLSIQDNLFDNYGYNKEDDIDDEKKNKNELNIGKILEAKYVVSTSDVLSLANLFIDIINCMTFKPNKNNRTKLDYYFNYSILNNIISANKLNRKVALEVIDIIASLLEVFYRKETNLEINNSNVICLNNTNNNGNNASNNTLISSINKTPFIPLQHHSILIQTILSGYLDNVAKKKILNNKVVYENNENSEITKIHLSSVLVKEKPEYICYKEILSQKDNDKNSKVFLFSNSVITKEWIFNICGSQLIKVNTKNNIINPVYVTSEDKIKCSLDFSYGKNSWSVTDVLVDMEEYCRLNSESNNKNKNVNNNISSNDLLIYSWFAKFLFDGVVVDHVKDIKKYLMVNTTSFIKDLFNPNISAFISLLSKLGITNKSTLISKIKQNKINYGAFAHSILGFYNLKKIAEECFKKDIKKIKHEGAIEKAKEYVKNMWNKALEIGN